MCKNYKSEPILCLIYNSGYYSSTSNLLLLLLLFSMIKKPRVRHSSSRQLEVWFLIRFILFWLLSFQHWTLTINYSLSMSKLDLSSYEFIEEKSSAVYEGSFLFFIRDNFPFLTHCTIILINVKIQSYISKCFRHNPTEIMVF